MCNLALLSALCLEGCKWERDARFWAGLQEGSNGQWKISFAVVRFGWRFEKKHGCGGRGQAWKTQELSERYHEHACCACPGYVAFNRTLGKPEWLITNDTSYGTGEVTYALNSRKGRVGRNRHLIYQEKVLQTQHLGLMFSIFLRDLEKVVQANSDNVYNWWNIIQDNQNFLDSEKLLK